MSDRAKPGTRPKGDRAPITVRVPRSHFAVYEEHARSLGMPLSDYIGMQMARLHELEEPEYLSRYRQQSELPLGA